MVAPQLIALAAWLPGADSALSGHIDATHAGRAAALLRAQGRRRPDQIVACCAARAVRRRPGRSGCVTDSLWPSNTLQVPTASGRSSCATSARCATWRGRLRWPARRQRARTLCGAAGAARRGWAARRLSPHRHRSRPRRHELDWHRMTERLEMRHLLYLMYRSIGTRPLHSPRRGNEAARALHVQRESAQSRPAPCPCPGPRPCRPVAWAWLFELLSPCVLNGVLARYQRWGHRFRASGLTE